MMLRLLIDECLTPRLVAVAMARGHDSTHVTFLGKAGLGDWNLVPLAIADDLVLVTNNARDFIALFARIKVHPGLILILPERDREQQVRLFQAALDTAEALDSLVNRIIEVRESGEVEVRDWSPS